MNYSIGIFFCLFIFFGAYLYSKSKSNSKGKFDIKAAKLDRDSLIWHAGNLARNHELEKGRESMKLLLGRVEQNFRYISATYRKLSEVAAKNQKLTGADEWLLDNFYIVEEQTKDLLQNIQKKYFNKLPVIKEGQYKGYPRVFAIALEYLNHTDCAITEDALIEFISEYQQISYLLDVELWSLSSILKIALIENIKHMCRKISKTQDQYEAARAALTNIFEKKQKYSSVLGPIFKNSLTENFDYIEYIYSAFKKMGKEGINGIKYIDSKLARRRSSPEYIVDIEHQRQAAREVSMGNAMTSLRFIMSLDYVKVFESLSQIEKILSEDYSGIYSKMDNTTKDYYRRNVERIAKTYDLSEIEVALTAVELSHKQKKHVGHFIIETDLGGDNKRSLRVKQSLYWSAILIITLLVSGGFFAYCKYLTQNLAISLGAFALVLAPASSIAINICNYVASHTTKVSRIPRLDLIDGIPKDCSTFVVISTLLTSVEQAKHMASQLEIYYLANKHENLYFGLLSDFADSDIETKPEELEILEAAKSVIGELNEKYGGQFFMFHRKRIYNEVNKNYMSWERKRGALVEFSKLLRGDKDTTFTEVVGDFDSLPEIKYVITLDADTKLPRDAAKELIGAMMHPLNKPEVKDGRVRSGYAIMQPRIIIDVESANTSFFSRVFAGQGGIDTYSGAVSDVYQDLFGEGIFTGKGIFDVDVFNEILPSAIPENTVLSHDLLEGSYLRCALVGDIALIDGFPWKYSSYAARMHRWTRGDWQLMPWLLGIIKNPLSGISKWKIFDNIRRSVVPVVLALLIFLSFNILPGNSFMWVGFAVSAICFSLLISTIDWAVHAGYKYIGQKCNATIIYGLKGVVYEAALLFVLLPHYAYITADAGLRTLYRMIFSKKKMLEWMTAADSERKLDNSLKSYYIRMTSSWIFALALPVFANKYHFLSIILTAVWLAAPTIMYFASKKEEPSSKAIKDSDKKFLIDLARDTWQYFKEYTSGYTNYLAPDNYQEEPANGSATRTSPTNIGLQISAVICAVDFGFISINEGVNMLERVVSTMERLQKWHGHFYNWYDTKTLEVLKPRYVSTVDSGNLCSYMLLVMESLREYKKKYPEISERVENLISSLKKMYDETDFKVLYDNQRHLFSIGYNVEEENLTKSHYDLLASEARTASFIAIAKGDVPKKHWFNLGRTLVSREGYRGLVSWTGTMFEYLMPLLLMKNIKNTLFDETYHFVIRCQKKYGRLRNVPWGTSESGFNAFDINLNYQYKAFGVPDLGLKRGLMSDMVVAPYASIMALMVDFDGAMENLRHLKEVGAMGRYGFYEAIDYTPQRILPHEKYSIVKSYMVHHVGMSLLTLNNVLNDNVLQKRFHADPSIKATEELLGERVPTNVIVSKENQEKVTPLKPVKHQDGEYFFGIKNIDVNTPNMHILSNGKMSSFITDGGVGYLAVGDMAVTRFRNDLQNGIYGNFVYIKNSNTGKWWTNTVSPLFENTDCYAAAFSSDRAEFKRRSDNIDTTTEIVVSSEENAEIRKITLANHTDEDIVFEISNYQEIVMTSLASDSAHPAFSNLFIRTEYDENLDCIIASRRPRDDKTPQVFAMQTICIGDEKVGKVEFETDRVKFIGRKKSLQRPNALTDGIQMSGSLGSVLDPIFSQRFKVRVNKGSSTSFSIITAYCENREEAVEIAQKYKIGANIDRAFDMAWTRSKVENKYLGISEKNESLAYMLLPHLFYILPYRRKLATYIEKNTKGQQSLWSMGISGDNPIVTLRVYSTDELDILKDLISIHELWQIKGLVVDLVIVSEDESSYNQPLINAIRDLASISHLRDRIGGRGGIYVVDKSLIDEDTKNLLFAVSKIVLDSNNGSIEEQMETEEAENTIPYISFSKKYYDNIDIPLGEIAFFNGYGGFTETEYKMKLGENTTTPMPWCNVIANRDFGFLVTESGGGFSWYHNSRENKLTPWVNDAVLDTAHDKIYIRDDHSGDLWDFQSGEYVVSHGMGYSKFETGQSGLISTLEVFVPTNELTKVNLITLTNKTSEQRNITLTYYINPIIGVGESETKPYVTVSKKDNFILAKNSYNRDYPEEVLYLSSSEQITSFTSDKREFFGKSRFAQTPNGLLRERLSNLEGAGLDSCIAAEIKLSLAPNETKSAVFTLGVKEITFTPKEAMLTLLDVKKFWKNETEKIKIDTPDTAMNFLVNSWLLYQTLSCRIFARTGFYQCGGAYGYRDQIQDTMSLLQHDSQIAKEQIIRCASRQFLEGDVQHWWHEVETGFRGIRTRFSDDLLWLPYAVSEYIRVTGDRSILEIKVPYIQSELLAEGEDEKYCPAWVSDTVETIEQHCMRAIERASRFGEHGLPLMGSGDWNDGMSHVGNKGKGESVWLGWFLYDILERFNMQNKELKESLNKAWDGAWYHRAYTDEGVPLGSNKNTECKIDAIAQAWSVITGAGNPEYQSIAMDSVMKYLVSREEGIIKLLTPPFDSGEINPGYIKGYVPGVRENGGQYTHAAAWVILAYAKLGMGDVAAELFSLLNPINHSRTPIEANKYKVEPYVVAADVYSTGANLGRGGWTWYTGSSGWMYRVAIEWILGIQKKENKLVINPCVPKDWSEFSVQYRHGDTKYNIHFKNPNGKFMADSPTEITLDDKKQEYDIEIVL
jgi:cyclic beta-1,2-glucan synthetase